MLADVTRPLPGVVTFHELLADVVDHRVQERAGAASRVEDKDLGVLLERSRGLARLGLGPFDLGGVGQAVGAVETGLEQVVDGADDVRDDRLGCEVDAARLAEFLVVGGKERLVEVDDGVLPLGPLAEFFENPVDVSVCQELDQVVDEAGVRLVGEVAAGDCFEELPQKWVCLWNL